MRVELRCMYFAIFCETPITKNVGKLVWIPWKFLAVFSTLNTAGIKYLLMRERAFRSILYTCILCHEGCFGTLFSVR